MAADAVRDRPRLRSERTNGAKVAEMIAASRIDAVTTNSWPAMYAATAARATAAITRQPIPAALISHVGTTCRVVPLGPWTVTW
jgi:hypothetical protein